MGLRRPGIIKDYEEMPGTNVPDPSMHTNHNHNHHLHNSRNQNHSTQLPQRHVNQTVDMTVCQDLEMSSVSVVPDGALILIDLN